MKAFSNIFLAFGKTRSRYRPQRSCGQGNVFTGVCLSTGGEGRVSASVHAGMPYPPDGEPPPDGDTPPGWRNPPGWRPPMDRGTPPDGGPPPRWRTPPDQADPPWMENPPRMEEPPPGSRLQHTVYEQPVRILLECILVLRYYSNFAPPLVMNANNNKEAFQ